MNEQEAIEEFAKQCPPNMVMRARCFAKLIDEDGNVTEDLGLLSEKVVEVKDNA